MKSIKGIALIAVSMDAAERKARQDELKKAAAEKALEWLTPGQVVEIGRAHV